MTAPSGLNPTIEGDSNVSLDASREHCLQVTREQAKNFYYGMKILPDAKRSAMYAIYAWMRMADDLADEAADAEQKKIRLEKFWSDTELAMDSAQSLPGGLLWPSLRNAIDGKDRLPGYLREMLEGQLLDQHKNRYATFEELYDYCYKVASIVGLTCIEVWGYEGDEETRQLAEWRGIAYQLTNILRDVREDAERDRIYLPACDFPDDRPPQPSDFLGPANDDILQRLWITIDRAEEHYRKSEPLIKLVSADSRPCLWAMTRIYHGLLEKIKKNPAAVLTTRVRLSKLQKIMIAIRAKWQSRSV